MEILYILFVLIALVVGYFAFVKKPAAPQLPPPEQAPRRPEALAEPARPKSPAALPEPQQVSAPPAPVAPPPAPKAELREEPPPPAGLEPEPTVAPPAPAVSEPRKPASVVRAAFAARPDPASLRAGLARSRAEQGVFGRLKALFSRAELSPALVEEIEQILLSSDVGVATTRALVERIRQTMSRGDLADADKVWDALRDEATKVLDLDGQTRGFTLRGTPTVVLLVGVNGAGKTTTIGKLAAKLKREGLGVVLAAGDTFRAAAVQQLLVWGERVGCEVVRGKDGADPSSVIFDAIQQAKASGADVVLADTAGRLHTKKNLMEEMKKIVRTAAKALDGAPHEVLLVLDATNGQNALAQAAEFKEALDLTGIVLTKLDGTAKGGVVLGISDSLHLPVRFVGMGERPDDLYEFSAADFVDALMGTEQTVNAA